MENGQSNRKSDFHVSAFTFSHAVEVLMRGYVLVSARGAPGEIWCDMNAALPHITEVDQLCKIDSKCTIAILYKINEIDAASRSEWARIAQINGNLQLSEIISAVSQRRPLLPRLSDFSIFRNQVRGKSNGNVQVRSPANSLCSRIYRVVLRYARLGKFYLSFVDVIPFHLV